MILTLSFDIGCTKLYDDIVLLGLMAASAAETISLIHA
jgi:hypothetical protein